MLVIGLISLLVGADRADSAANAIVVVLDAGHGGNEPGASANEIIERDSNLDMAYRVQRLLTAAGGKVEFTRSTYQRTDGFVADGLDGLTATFMDLQARVARANALDADVFVSLHSNSYTSSGARGVDVVYNRDRPFAADNQRLAGLLRDYVVAELRSLGHEVPSNVWVDSDLVDGYGRRTPMFVLGPEREISESELADRGLRAHTLGMPSGTTTYRTDETNAPGALLELLYLSNPQDAALLRDEVTRDAMSRGIANAILEFLRSRALIVQPGGMLWY